MEERPLWSRFAHFRAFVRLALKEAHAVVLAVIGGVLFLLASAFGPWLQARYYPSLALRQPTSLELLFAVAIVFSLLLFVGSFLVWEEEEREHFLLQERLKPNLRQSA
jgi:hypothetical protein